MNNTTYRVVRFEGRAVLTRRGPFDNLDAAMDAAKDIGKDEYGRRPIIYKITESGPVEVIPCPI